MRSNNDKNRTAEATRATVIGLVLNIILVVIKIFAGIFGKSAAVIADGIHSLSDSITDIAVIIGLRLADKPPDKGHRYGHGKIETLSALLVSLVLAGVGMKLLWSGGNTILQVLQGEALSTPGWIAVVAAAVSIIVKEWVYHYTFKIGKKINSQAVIANAWHHRSDAFSSIGVAIGVSCSILLGGKWLVLDPIASVIVSLLILFTAISISRTCLAELLETSLGEEIENEIAKIANEVDGAQNAHNIRTRRIGANIAMDMHIEVDHNLLITDAHDICDQIENALKTRFGEFTFVTVHCEPTRQA